MLSKEIQGNLLPNPYEVIADNLTWEIITTNGCNFEMAQDVINKLPPENPAREALEDVLKNNPLWQQLNGNGNSSLPKCG